MSNGEKTMAERIVFCPCIENIGVRLINISFKYFPGFAISQAQKSIKSLHDCAKEMGLNNILEVSTKSENELGVSLSAFNLKGNLFPFNTTVEKNFQSSKVFENGGPYSDILQMESIKAKKDIRLRNSGRIIKFIFNEEVFDINPPTLFYDWLYINTLIQNHNIVNELLKYNNFTDIAFNNKKSINCQAYSIALFRSMQYNNINLEQIKKQETFLKLTNEMYKKRWNENNTIKNTAHKTNSNFH